MKNVKEQGQLRITTYGNSSIVITNCEHAGKRGKDCDGVSISLWAKNIGQLFCDVVHNMDLKLENLINWEEAKKFVRLAKELKNSENKIEVYFTSEKSIRVAPLGFEKIVVGNDKFCAEVAYENFSASDLEDQANYPRWISTSKQRKADFKKVYNFVKENQEKLNAPEITFQKFISIVSDATGVYGHQYCAD